MITSYIKQVGRHVTCQKHFIENLCYEKYTGIQADPKKKYGYDNFYVNIKFNLIGNKNNYIII